MESPESGRQCTVIVEGLWRRTDGTRDGRGPIYTDRFSLKGSAPLSSLWEQIIRNGYMRPETIQQGPKAFSCYETKNGLSFFEQVTVVADDQPSTKNRIRLSDMLIVHANMHYGKPVDFNINEDSVENPKRPKRSLRDSCGLNISFQRTTRMPDDDKLHQLPGSLGTYDLYNVEAYSAYLPKNIREAGGVFFPMWQREAMWINFESETNKYSKWAVRVYVGRISAISGLRMDEDPSSDGEQPQQDYAVIPDQRWLDGICVSPGIVRQFVAMPLGSGYTVEGQKTSEEKHGGLQIEIIPEFQTELRWWVINTNEYVSHSANGSVTVDRKEGFNEYKTPAELGFRVGDILRSYPSPPALEESFTIGELFDAGGHATFKADYGLDISAGYKVRALRTGTKDPEDSTLVLSSLGLPVTASAGSGSGSSLKKGFWKKGPAPESSLTNVVGSKKHKRRSKSSTITSLGAIASSIFPWSGRRSMKKCAEEARRAEVEEYGFNPNTDPTLPPVVMAEDQSGYRGCDNTTTTTKSYGYEYSASGGPRHYHPTRLADEFVEEDERANPSVVQVETTRGGIGVPVQGSEEKGIAADEEILGVESKDLKAMGLAAGGKLVQDIYKDPYPANIWNHAAARIIHVHILDPVSCEKVTHIVPAPPPMDVESYVEEDGQFYVVEEKVDERLEGGDFDNIKSVSEMDKHIGVSTEPEFDPLKPKQCMVCELRLCDCIIRPCDHQFCNVCIKTLEKEGEQDPVLARKNWKCPTCNQGVSHVAGFSAPMNLPGEKPMRMKVPVHVLEINDGRIKFSSIQKTRI